MTFLLFAGLGVVGALLASSLLSGGKRDGSKASAFVRAALEKIGEPYQWGGGHSPNTWGLDCSGLVIVAAREAGVTLPAGVVPTADGFFHGLPSVDNPQPGDLAFYGTPASKAQHVVIITDENGGTVGANGGDSTVTTPLIAHNKGAKVSTHKNYTQVRRDFIGFRRLV